MGVNNRKNNIPNTSFETTKFKPSANANQPFAITNAKGRIKIPVNPKPAAKCRNTFKSKIKKQTRNAVVNTRLVSRILLLSIIC